MKKNISTFSTGALTVMGVATLCGTARADLSYSTSANITSYLGTPTYSTAIAGATTAQGQPTQTGTFSVLSETFTPTSGFTLGGFNILSGGGLGNVIGVHLFDVTLSLTSNNGTVLNGSGATYPAGGTDLFGNGAGLSFTISTTAEVQSVFTLNNGTTSDLVPLTAGHTYALEFWTPAVDTQNGFLWYRGSTADPGGEGMASGDSSAARVTLASAGLAGAAPRTFADALYAATATPEPSTMALLALGGVAGAFGLRRKKA
jgi:PEP-CTERM motif